MNRVFAVSIIALTLAIFKHNAKILKKANEKLYQYIK